jgi:hypothetical protein
LQEASSMYPRKPSSRALPVTFSSTTLANHYTQHTKPPPSPNLSLTLQEASSMYSRKPSSSLVSANAPAPISTRVPGGKTQGTPWAGSAQRRQTGDSQGKVGAQQHMLSNCHAHAHKSTSADNVLNNTFDASKNFDASSLPTYLAVPRPWGPAHRPALTPQGRAWGQLQPWHLPPWPACCAGLWRDTRAGSRTRQRVREEQRTWSGHGKCAQVDSTYSRTEHYVKVCCDRVDVGHHCAWCKRHGCCAKRNLLYCCSAPEAHCNSHCCERTHAVLSLLLLCQMVCCCRPRCLQNWQLL